MKRLKRVRSVLEELSPVSYLAMVLALGASVGGTVQPPKTVGIDPLPSGIALSNGVLTIAADDTQFTGWLIENGEQVVVAADRVRIAQNVWQDPDDNVAECQRYNVVVNTDVADAIIEDNTFIGSNGFDERSTTILQSFAGEALAATTATNTIVRRNNFLQTTADTIKTAGGGTYIYENYFGPARNYDPDTPYYDDDTPYAVGDYVLQIRSNGAIGVYKCIQATSGGNAPSTDLTHTAYWQNKDPHGDVINPTGSIGAGIHIFRNLFDIPAIPGVIGLTNILRAVRNTGTNIPVNIINFVGNVIKAWGGYFPFGLAHVRPYKTTTNYPLRGFSALGTEEVPTEYFETLQPAVQSPPGQPPGSNPIPLTDTAFWKRTHDILVEGILNIHSNYLTAGLNGNFFSYTLQNSHVIWGENVNFADSATVAGPRWSIEYTGQKAEADYAIETDLPTYSDAGMVFDITPTAYAAFVGSDGVEVLAAVVAVGGRVVAYRTSTGGLVSRPNIGITVTDQGSGVLRLSSDAGIGMSVAVVAGEAAVMDVTPVANPNLVPASVGTFDTAQDWATDVNISVVGGELRFLGAANFKNAIQATTKLTPVTEGSLHRLSIDVISVGAGTQVRAILNYYDSNGTSLNTNVNTEFGSVAVDVPITLDFTPPTAAAFVQLQVQTNSGNNTVTLDNYEVSLV